MKPSFWRALEKLGAAGAASLSWQHVLGGDWDANRHLLPPTGREARTVLHPLRPGIHLDLMPEGEEDFAAVCDDCSIPPIVVSARDAAELQPCWSAIAQALGAALGFSHAHWPDEGSVRRIGTAHNAAGIITPVLLFLPPGCFGDDSALFECLASRAKSLVLLPSIRWMSPSVDALRSSIGHEFVALAERLTQPADLPGAPKTLPVIAQDSASPKVKPVIRPADGMSWEDVTVTILTGRTISIAFRGQEGTHTFRNRSIIGRLHPLGILMELARSGQWTNPPKKDREYDRSRLAFRTVRNLLGDLVPFPGEPFGKSGGAYIPVFRIRLGQSLSRNARQESKEEAGED